MSAEVIEAPGADFVIHQGYERYGDDEHAIWRTLFHRQSELLKDRAAPEFLAGLAGLGIAADGIPEFERLSDVLERATRWRIVAVPGLVPDDVFFRHLANRRFPATNSSAAGTSSIICRSLTSSTTSMAMCRCCSIRSSPIICRPTARRVKALALDSLPFLARLYWYTVKWGSCAPRRLAHLRLRHRLLEGEIDLRTGEREAETAALRPHAHHAD